METRMTGTYKLNWSLFLELSKNLQRAPPSVFSLHFLSLGRSEGLSLSALHHSLNLIITLVMEWHYIMEVQNALSKNWWSPSMSV